jgi:hypothetical protein
LKVDAQLKENFEKLPPKPENNGRVKRFVITGSVALGITFATFITGISTAAIGISVG